MKPDSTRSAIVEAIRRAGASWVDTEGRAGTPDGAWGFRGRMGFAEIKRPDRVHGACGCTAVGSIACEKPPLGIGLPCLCKGHPSNGGSKTSALVVWHRQLEWHEAWQGPPVAVWTTPEEALRTIGALP